MVAAGAQMSGDALALEKDLDGARGQPHLDFAAGKAIRHAVEMTLELDMVVDTDPDGDATRQRNRVLLAAR